MQNLKRVVWFITRPFFHSKAAIQGVYFHLRLATNNPAPNAYTVEHIPLLAAELRRLMTISDQVRQITQQVETEAIKRILRKGESSEKVLARLAAEAANSARQLREQAKDFPAWMENEMISFSKREAAYFGVTHDPEQIDFFASVV